MLSDKSTLDVLNKIFGENATNERNKFIDTGFPPLNKICSGKYVGGGLPYGRIVEIVGESSTGKTALATKLMLEVQKLEGIAIFVDWERSFSIPLAENLGLRTEQPYFFYTTPNTWEDGNTQVNNLCEAIRENDAIPADAPIIAIFDSVASAVPQSTFDKKIDAYTMNDTTALARVSSTTLKVMAQKAWNTNATYVYLNQVRTVPGAYVPTTSTPGGKAMEYFSSIRLFLSRKKIVSKDKAFLGQEITIEARKNKITKPFQSCKLNMIYDEMDVPGFDLTSSLIDELIAIGKLEMAGVRISFEGKTYYKNALVKKINDEGRYSELCKMLESEGEK